MKAQEEIKARLEVAQLYEEMGQLPKSARYYLAGAEIALKAKLFDYGRELLHKVLELDPENSQAKTYLKKLDDHLVSLGHAPKKNESAAVENTSASKSVKGKVTLPTPALYLRRDQISAILAQVSSAPNPKFFPFTRLPALDAAAVEEKNKKLEAVKEEVRAKERTAVESAFGNSNKASFTSSSQTSGFLNQAQRSGRSSRRNKNNDPEENTPSSGRRRGGRRGGNQSLADSIRKRLDG